MSSLPVEVPKQILSYIMLTNINVKLPKTSQSLTRRIRLAVSFSTQPDTVTNV